MTDLDREAPPADTVELVEARLEELTRRFRIGDVTAKGYARLRQDLLARLGRCRIAPLLEPGESVTAEHHWVEATSELPASPFAETALASVSLYATDRRLFRWRFRDTGANDAPSRQDLDEGLDVRWYTQVTAVRRHREVRWGEALAGIAIAAAGVLLYGHLRVTAPFILGVGAFGVLHALLMPTRRATLRAEFSGEPDWLVSAVGTRSGRALLARIRDLLPPPARGA